MIEPIMYVGLGLFAASLLALVVMPIVHARAVRLAMHRLEAPTPLPMAEIQADKDQLRAELAMSLRQLEASVEQLKSKTIGQLAELAKKTHTINRLEVELGENTAAVLALEARDKALRDQLDATEEELSTSDRTLREVRRALADKELQLAWITADLDQRLILADGQQSSRHWPRRAMSGVTQVPIRTEVAKIAATAPFAIRRARGAVTTGI